MSRKSEVATRIAGKTIGWSALAAMLALAAAPVAANAQDRDGRRSSQQSQQSSQNRGEGYRYRGSQSGAEQGRSQTYQRQSGSAQVRQQPPASTASKRGGGLVRTDQRGSYQARDNRGDQRNAGSRGNEAWRNNNDQRRDNNWRNDNNRRDNNWHDHDRRVSNSRDRNNDGRNWSNRNDRRWDRDWRGNNRYDWRSYRSRHRNTYRLGRYYAPYPNYAYRRIGIGFHLSTLFYGNRYWLSDPWQYRLPEVYGPYRWVRYYDDVLLVNIYTGEVVDVIHDFFW